MRIRSLKAHDAAFLKPLPNGSIGVSQAPEGGGAEHHDGRRRPRRIRCLRHSQACCPARLGRGRKECHRRGQIHHALYRPEAGQAETAAPDPQPRLRPAAHRPEFQGREGQGRRAGRKDPARTGHRYSLRPRPAAHHGGRRRAQDLGGVQPSRQRPQQQAPAVRVHPGRQGQAGRRGQGQTRPSQALFVEDPQHKKWLVDSEGKAFEFNGGSEAVNDTLRRTSSAPPSPSRCPRTSWTPSSCSRASSASACLWSPGRGARPATRRSRRGPRRSVRSSRTAAVRSTSWSRTASSR